MPPLRERIEDIRPLVEHFRKTHKSANKAIMMEVIKKFERYPWPGNVRELYTELTRLFVWVANEPRITLKHLDSKFFAEPAVAEKAKGLLNYAELKALHKADEIRLIKAHLKKFRNLRDAASEGLGVPYSTLFSRMKALGLIEKEVESETKQKPELMEVES